MKTWRRAGWLLMAALLLITAVGCAQVSGAGKPAYQAKAEAQNWEKTVDEAIALWSDSQSVSSTVDITVTPEAFAKIYALGPDVVPYLLNRLADSGKNGGEEMFLMTAVRTNLQLYADAGGYVAEDNPYDVGTAQYAACNTRAFLKEVPEQVKAILDSTDTDAQKLQALDRLGLAALPCVVERVQAGETQWTPYLETQLLGMSTDARFAALQAEAAFSGDNAAEQIYAHRRQTAQTVDAAQWIAANGDVVTALEEIV